MALNYRSLLIPPTNEGLDRAATLLRTGQLLAFPTETVYGLGADATNTDAVLNIFKAKGRPLTDPLIVHVAEPHDATTLVELEEDEQLVFNRLATAFWPGPLTQIVKASSRIPPAVTANTGFVGIRIPNHPLARALLQRAQVPVAAPSANRFGHVSPTRAKHVLDDLGEKGVHVLDGESRDSVVPSSPCEFGIESTVIKLDRDNREVIIFRQGAVSQRDIEKVLSKAQIAWSIRAVVRTVKMHAVTDDSTSNSPDHSIQSTISDAKEAGEVAPGQAVTHYAPDVPCFILSNLTTSVSESMEQTIHLSVNDTKTQVVLIDFGGKYADWRDRVLSYRDLSPEGNSSEAARQLFDTLRWSESQSGARFVFITPISIKTLATAGMGDMGDISLGVADRIFRAASGQSAAVVVTDK